MYIIRLVALADGRTTGLEGQYLKSCDFEAEEGRGVITVTEDANLALTFQEVLGAMLYWKTQSKVAPFRPDGKPNRPLTSYTVNIEEVPE